VRKLYHRLRGDGFDPWLDEENLEPGQHWEKEIARAVRNSDVVIVCLSHDSTTKTGYVQKEIKFALDVADRQPEDAVFLIPVKLEECAVPERLSQWHWVSLFEERGYDRLLRSLTRRSSALAAPHPAPADSVLRPRTAGGEQGVEIPEAEAGLRPSAGGNGYGSLLRTPLGVGITLLGVALMLVVSYWLYWQGRMNGQRPTHNDEAPASTPAERAADPISAQTPPPATEGPAATPNVDISSKSTNVNGRPKRRWPSPTPDPELMHILNPATPNANKSSKPANVNGQTNRRPPPSPTPSPGL
jgi:hypothetical protein